MNKQEQKKIVIAAKLVRMFDKWCERGCDLSEADFISRMWACAQVVSPQCEGEEFNLSYLEQALEEADEVAKN